MPPDDDLEALRDAAQRGRGRPPNDDDALLVLVDQHLRDPDLVERARAGKQILSQAIKRAICDLHRDGDIQENGSAGYCAARAAELRFFLLRRARTRL